MKNILIISVHPDDETLGCGGTILKHKELGDSLNWLIITSVKKEYGYSEERIVTRNNEINKVKIEYGFQNINLLDYKPGGLSSDNQFELINDISNLLEKIKPEIIYLVNRSDAHSDHRYAFTACIACTKSFRAPYIKKVLMYECMSETEFAPQFTENVFTPNYFVDITNFIEKKAKIMEIYKSELGVHPFPRSIENIYTVAKFRGTVAGVHFAEAFQLVKYIDK